MPSVVDHLGRPAQQPIGLADIGHEHPLIAGALVGEPGLRGGPTTRSSVGDQLEQAQRVGRARRRC